MAPLEGARLKKSCLLWNSPCRIFDWARWTFPHNWEPYIHIGLSSELYSRSLYSRLTGDRALISQCRLLAFSFRSVLLASMCRRHVSPLSRCTPRYVTSFRGSIVLILYIRTSSETLSNAWETSKNMAVQYSPFRTSSEFLILSGWPAQLFRAFHETQIDVTGFLPGVLGMCLSESIRIFQRASISMKEGL